MAVHRYWSARGFSVLAGRALSLSEFHLYLAGSRIDAAAALTSNIAPATGAVADLKDDDLATSARWLSQEGVALSWDFGVGGGVDLDGIRVGSSGAPQAEFPVSCSVWFSDDATTWTRHADWAADYPGSQQKTTGFYNWQPNDFAVVSQLEFVGANGSTTFTDDVAGNVWTPAGAAQIKTDQFKWGDSSGYFNGSTDYIALPAKPSMNMIGTNFEVEAHIRLSSLANNYNTILANGLTSFVASSAFLMVYGNAAPVVANRGKLAIGNGSINPVLVSSTVLSTGVWYRIKAVGVKGVVALYINDVLDATLVTGAFFDFSLSGTVVGRNGWDGAAGYFAGHIGEFRVTRGIDADDGLVPAFVRHPPPKRTLRMDAYQPTAKIASGVGLWPFTGGSQTPAPVRTRGDYLTGVLGTGRGRVRGTTKDKGTPNVPVSERVRLYREQDGLLIRELWSTPGTGAYSFDHVDELQTYTVLSYDHNKNFRAVVADGLTLANGGVELIA